MSYIPNTPSFYSNKAYKDYLKHLYFPEVERFYIRREFDPRTLNYKINDTLIINIYPDTLAWLKDTPVSFSDPFCNMYFWHPAYDNYPVVGLSLDQIQAYCSWYENELNKSSKDTNIRYSVQLPDLHHYEFALKRCLSPYDMNQVNVFPSEPLSYQRNWKDASCHITKAYLSKSTENSNNPEERRFNQWLSVNATSPIFGLLSQNAEVVQPRQKNDSVMTVLGPDRFIGLIDPKQNQFNTLFYQRHFPKNETHSTVGFRLVVVTSAKTKK